MRSIRYLNSFAEGFRRGREKTNKSIGRFLIALYAIASVISIWLDREGLVALFLVLMFDQSYSLEIAKLRTEIRAKRMWHEGGFE